MATRSVSEYAVPAMSRWTHGYSSANSFRNIAAVIVPPARPPVFLMSATSDLISSLYSSHSGLPTGLGALRGRQHFIDQRLIAAEDTSRRARVRSRTRR
jgi:hypothetical protein